MPAGGMMSGFLISLLVTALFTPIIRLGALALGWEYRPDPKKWKRKTNPHNVRIALGGGMAIFFGFAASAIFSHSQFPYAFHPLLLLLLPFCAMVLGLYDDLRSPRPISRLAIQTLLGFITVALIGWVKGLPVWLAIPITIFAVVGLMNSVNMMDNMDGVASGLMTLAMLGYAVLGYFTNNPTVTYSSLAVMGASLGFWLYNRPPALIFMGDTGSLLLGYLLAVVGTIATWGEYSHWFKQLVAPLLLANVFITDTTFVVLYRWRHGLPVMHGDRNHMSHRLAVLWGYSEWKANLTLYSLQFLAIAASLIVMISPLPVAVITSLAMFILLATVCYLLWKVQVVELVG